MPKGLSLKYLNAPDGLIISDVDVDGLDLDACRSLARPLEDRPRLQRSRLSNVRARSCVMGWAVLEDVVIDGFASDGQSSLWNSFEFSRVTIRGQVGEIQIQQFTDKPWRQLYLDRLRDLDAVETDWSLDISEAEGDIAICGYSARRIRRDPERQAVVRLEQTRAGAWKNVNLRGTLFDILLEDHNRMGWPDTILSASSSGRRSDAQKRAIAELRALGIAEKD